jgi:hypothetical protein
VDAANEFRRAPDQLLQSFEEKLGIDRWSESCSRIVSVSSSIGCRRKGFSSHCFTVDAVEQCFTRLDEHVCVLRGGSDFSLEGFLCSAEFTALRSAEEELLLTPTDCYILLGFPVEVYRGPLASRRNWYSFY